MDNKDINSDEKDLKLIKVDASMVVPEVKDSSDVSIDSRLGSMEISNEQLLGTSSLKELDVDVKEINTDEVLVEKFVGKNYKKILKKNFSFCAFLFGGFYYLYRKMYVYGFSLLLLQFIIFNFFDFIYVLVFFVILSIILGLFTKRIYLDYVKKNIYKIKKNNPDCSFDALVEICSREGHGSILMILMGMLIVIFITFIWFIVSLIYGVPSMFMNLFDIDNIKEENNLNGNDFLGYSGILNYDDSIDMNSLFEFRVPDKFRETVMNDVFLLNYEYVTKEGMNFSKCEIEFGSIMKYSSSEKLVEEMVNYYLVDTTLKSEIINQINWKTFIVDLGYGKVYYYVTERDNKVYLLKYSIGKNVIGGICENYDQDFIQSIYVK